MTITVLDIAKSTGDDGIVALIEEVVKYVPEMAYFPARTIKGTQYKATVRTDIPTARFRKANKGAVIGQSKYENRLYDCYITDQPWLCDKMVADAHEDGAAAFIAAEGAGMVKAQGILLGKQFWYGNPEVAGTAFSDDLGFPGMMKMYDSSGMTVTVSTSGSTAGTGSSVWAVCGGGSEDGAQWLYGNGSNPLQLTDVKEVVLNDASSNPLTQYHQQLLAWVGCKLGNLKCAARIKNLTEDSGKTLTDALLADLVDCFPTGYVPDAIFMTRRSRKQLKKSRTATSDSGKPAPMPTEYEGIPIIVTDSLQNTEALT